MIRGGDTPSQTQIKIAIQTGSWVFGNLLQENGNYEMEIYTHGENSRAIIADDDGRVMTLSGAEWSNDFIAFLEGIMASTGIEISASFALDDNVLQLGDYVPN